MEKKKSKRADLENKKLIFLQTGLIITLSIVLAAFEWRTTDAKRGSLIVPRGADVELLLPVNTVQPKPLPPPPAPKPVIVLKVVDNDDPVDGDIRVDDGIRPEDPVPVYPLVPDEPDDTGDDEFFIVVEHQPEFPGGLEALYRFLGENIEYPEAAKESGIMGTVFVSFIIEKDGSASNIEVLRSPHPLLSEEALRVLKTMPKWHPGKQRERPVRVSLNIPIKFSLQN